MKRATSLMVSELIRVGCAPAAQGETDKLVDVEMLSVADGVSRARAAARYEVAVSLSGNHSAPYVVLSVLDRGAGIDPAELGSIVNPFIRGDRARGGQGAGLGLAIVKRIAALHGGSIELRNRSGGGLEARVCLPLGLLLPRDAV